MKNIRTAVFETNSSSMHSLAIRGKDEISRPGQLRGYFGEYGWGYETLNTCDEKLSYVLTALASLSEADECKLGMQEACKRLEGFKYFQWLNEMVKDYTGNVIDMDYEGGGWYPFGYIDHQSWNYAETHPEPLTAFWSNEKADFQTKMRDFIFNDKYTVIIDNDNH